MKIGYVRISTRDQNTARQDELMKSLGVEKVFTDKLSGKNTSRDEFQKMMAFLREGDTLYVESISRLARSTRDLLQTVAILSDRGVTLVFDKEKLDTETPHGKFVLTIFGAVAELERDAMLQRQREGIEIAKAEGKYKGRQSIPVTDRFFTVAQAWANGHLELRKAVAQSGMSQATFFRRCKEYGIRKNTTVEVV